MSADAAGLGSFSTATLHEAAGRQGALPSAIMPLVPEWQISGPAHTVATSPGQNLWIHRGLATAPVGSVLVVWTGGGYDFGYWGEVLSTAAIGARVAGLVIDGCVRDTKQLISLGFPVFCRGISILGTGKDPSAAGGVGSSLHFPGVVVRQGDAIVGDADGVVALAAQGADELTAVAEQRDRKEAGILPSLRKGMTTLDAFGLS